MDSLDAYTTFESRIATFEQMQQLPKRRASNVKKKHNPQSLSWPHTTPTPEELAKAGFYYKPTDEHADSVSCFLCGKTLDGWEPNDVPAFEHLAKVPDCGWAINICIEQRSQNMEYVEEDPLSVEMIESRKATFKDSWPHEKRKGWKCKTKKMVEAGWCYNPVPEGEDCVKCFYCGLTLDGWEPKDDPLEEHRRREPECQFFALIEEHKKQKKTNSRSKGKGVRSSKASSRASTQSNTTFMSEAPSFTSLEDFELPEDEADEGDTVMTTASTRSRTAARKPPRRNIVPKVTQTTKKISQITAEDISTTSEENRSTETENAGKSGSVVPNENTKRKRGRPSKRNTDQSIRSNEETIDASQTGSPDPKAARTRGRKPKQTEKNVGDEKHMKLDNLITDSHTIKEVPKRGKKRTSDGKEKLESSSSQPRPEVALGRVEAADSIFEDAGGNTTQRKSQSRDTRKHSIENDILQQLREREKTEINNDGITEETKEAGYQRGNILRKKSIIEQPENLHISHAEPMRIEISATKDAAEPVEGPKTNEVEERPATPEASVSVVRKGAPLQQPISPAQSSDAENQPPSSHPSKNSSQVSQIDEIAEVLNSANTEPTTMSIPLTIATPITSPSRRKGKAGGGLQSEHPWTAVDLEMALLQSSTPKKSNGDGSSFKAALQQLTSPEKHMSIEELIRRNAETAEERLKGECERLIGIFESEGLKAIQAVEGIPCA